MQHLKFGSEPAGRPVGQALGRGLRLKCPACGEGKLFCGLLTCRDHCPACGEELFHQRADDLPAYLDIFIVGHLAVGGYMLIDRSVSLQWWQHLMIWSPFILAATIALLPFAKGAIIGLQWALRMHGFGEPIGHDKPLRADD